MITEGDVTMAGVRGPLVLEDILYQAAKTSRIAPLQVVRADRVIGQDHVLSAVMHAQRAFAEGRNHADELPVELARYLAGERQIKKAFAKVGVADGVDGVVIGLGEKGADAVSHFMHALGLVEDDGLIAPTPEQIAAFGIEEAVLAITPEPLHADLVLERVAAVDLMRK